MKLVNITDLKSVGHMTLRVQVPLRAYISESRSDPMKYRLEERYVWIDDGTRIVKMYFINGVPFTFDDLPDGALYDKDLIEMANKEKTWDMEDLFKAYQYLMAEECNPLLFDLELENPELMPVD